MNKRTIISLLSLAIIGCGQTSTDNTPKHVDIKQKSIKDYSNKTIYKVKRGETFKIYYTHYDSFCSCWINENEVKSIRLNYSETYERDEANPCIGCDYKVGMVFQAIKAGIDTIKFSNYIEPTENACEKAKANSSLKGNAEKYIVIVSDSIYGGKTNLTQADTSKIYQLADQKPAYIGGDKALSKILTENFDFTTNSVSETSYYSLVISSSGEVIEILKLRGPVSNQQKLTVAIQKTSGQWNPGRKDGKRVNVYLTVAIKILGQNIYANAE